MEKSVSLHTLSLGKDPETPPQQPSFPPISSISTHWIGISAGKIPYTDVYLHIYTC